MRKVAGWALAVLGGALAGAGAYIGARAVGFGFKVDSAIIVLVPAVGAVMAVLIGAWLLLSGWRLSGASPEPPPYARRAFSRWYRSISKLVSARVRDRHLFRNRIIEALHGVKRAAAEVLRFDGAYLRSSARSGSSIAGGRL